MRWPRPPRATPRQNGALLQGQKNPSQARTETFHRTRSSGVQITAVELLETDLPWLQLLLDRLAQPRPLHPQKAALQVVLS